MSVFPIAIENDILFSEDTLFKLELNGQVFPVSKKWLKIRDVNSYSFYGQGDSNNLMLSFLNEDIQGVLTIDNHSYSIETYQNECYIVQIDNTILHEDCDGLDMSVVQDVGNDRLQEMEESGVEIISSEHVMNRFHDGSGDIKVLVMYTPAAANSVSNIVNTAYLAEELSNQSFDNSSIACKIEVVYIGKTDYVEVGSQFDVDRFQGTSDGYMDEVHSLRDKYAADVCVLLTDYHLSTCGRATRIKANSDSAFCVVQAYYCSTAYYSFIHEIGHLMGCRHDYEMDPRYSPYEFGHGYINPDKTWRTIMAYPNECQGCDRIQYWSNPYVIYHGETMGTTSLCNNAKVWNIRYEEVGAFESIATNVVISSNTIPNGLNYGFIEASSRVETSGNTILQSGQELTIKAGEEIVFSDGFESSAGSELNAFVSSSPATMLYVTLSDQPVMEVSPVRQIDANLSERVVSVFPNPTTNDLCIHNKGTDAPQRINILDIWGRIILPDIPMNLLSTSVDLSQLPSGIYFIDVEFANRHERFKIVKK